MPRLICGLVWAFALVAPLRTVEVYVTAVPAAAWNDGQPDLAQSVEADVLFYRKGSWAPEIVARTGEVVDVPVGQWGWVIESEAYVSVRTGVITNAGDALSDEDGALTLEPRQLVRPVVPACRVLLPDDWLGFARVDFVSLPYGSQYAIAPGTRSRLSIPKGNAVVWVTKEVRATGISRLDPCRDIDGPAPALDRSEQGLIAEIQLSTGGGDDESVPFDSNAEDIGQSVAGVLELAQGETRLEPIGRTVQQGNLYLFFGPLPAQAATLRLWGADILSTRIEVVPRRGLVQEVSVLSSPRGSIEASITYEPLQDHRHAEAVLLKCPAPRIKSENECDEMATQQLVQGTSRYGFDNLDVGFYSLSAQVDSELVFGLGHGVSITLDEGSPDHEMPDYRLREFAVQGTVYEDGTPVDGVVRWSRPPKTVHTSTEDLGKYEINYFGRHVQPGPHDVDEVLGAVGFEPTACSHRTGVCTGYSIHSRVEGSGRLDFEIPSDPIVRLTVVRAPDENPVAGSTILTDRPVRTAIVTPETTTVGEMGEHAEPMEFPVPRHGKLTLAADPGVLRFLARAPGYEDVSGQVKVPDHGLVEEVVRLPPKDTRSLAKLVFEDGTPVASGYLAASDPEGELIRACSTTTDNDGSLEIPASCTGFEIFTLFHPNAALEEFRLQELIGLRRKVHQVEKRQPTEIVVVDENGQPLEGTFVGLKSNEIELGLGDMVTVGTKLRMQSLIAPTGSDGRLKLFGFRLGNRSAPILVSYSASGKELARLDLSQLSPETSLVEVVVRNN